MTVPGLVDATIDYANYDYLIDGQPLYERLFKGAKVGGPNDFGMDGTSHMASAVICQPNTIERLMGDAKPDLIHGLTALYVCGHCGGYDGTLVGTHVNIYKDWVVWSNIGYSSDVIETYPKHEAFSHIPSFSFKRDNYNKFIENMRPYEIN